MASLLNYGAGAYSGLEDIMDRDFKRQVEERLLAASQASQAEQTRHNQAQEGLQGRTLDQNGQLRADAQKSLDESRITNAANLKRDDIRARVGMMAPGDKVSPQQYEEDTSIGMVPAGRYKQTPGQYQPLPDEQQGPAQEPPPDFEFLGVPQKKTGQPANLQMKTVSYQGKPVEANYNPDTGELTYRGKDITNEAGHFHEPPAPDRVMMWTDQGAVPRTDAAAAARKGAPVQPQATAATRTMGEGAKMLSPHIADLDQQAQTLNQAGLFGPIMSRVRDAAARAGSVDEIAGLLMKEGDGSQDANVGQFLTTLGLVATGAGRVHGGARGGGSPQMLQHFKDLLSSSSTIEMFQGRLKALENFMNTYAGGPGGDTGAGAGGGVPTVGGTFQGGKVLRVTPIQ